MSLYVNSNITVDGKPCSLEDGVLYFNDCVLRCVRLKNDNSLMYVREENIKIHSFNKTEEYINIPDMISYFMLITVLCIYLSSILVEVNKLIIN